MAVLVEGVRVSRAGRLVLDIDRLALRPGRTTALLGPNGSGKTTLLRVMAGLERPDSGRVLIDDVPVRGPQPVAYVFQESVFLRRSVRENLALGPRLRGVPAPETAARIAEAAGLLGIGGLLDRRADRLSGGEARRVSLARALCLRASLVLLDEPLEALDGATYIRLLDELPQVLGAFDATTVLVTHSRHEAQRLAEDLVVLIDGRVAMAGETRSIVRQPRTSAVADALGYLVLPADSRLVAVPPDRLRVGPGAVTFTMLVEATFDVIEGVEAVGRIGNVRVRVALPPDVRPAAGEPLTVHADEGADVI